MIAKSPQNNCWVENHFTRSRQMMVFPDPIALFLKRGVQSPPGHREEWTGPLAVMVPSRLGKWGRPSALTASGERPVPGGSGPAGLYGTTMRRLGRLLERNRPPSAPPPHLFKSEYPRLKVRC